MKSVLKMVLIAGGVYVLFRYLEKRKSGSNTKTAINEILKEAQSDGKLIASDVVETIAPPSTGNNTEYFSKMIVRDYVATPEATIVPPKTVIG